MSQMPSHNHDVLVSTATGTQNNPDGALLAGSPNVRLYRPTAPTGAFLAADTIGSSGGGSQAHDNIMPFLCVNFIIALFGIYPSRE